MDINDLRKSVSEMSETELMDLIIERRAERSVSKAAPKRAAKAAAVDVKKKESRMDKAINGISVEEAMRLLAKLQEKV